MLTAAKKKGLVVAQSGVLLLVSIVVVFFINVPYALNPWNIAEITLLWCFFISCIVFPKALWHYRTERRLGARNAWYRYPDLVLCLLGLVSGMLITLSIIQNWILSSFHRPFDPGLEFVPPRSVIGLDPFLSFIGTNGHVSALMLAAVLANLCWSIVVLVLIVQVLKQKNASMHR
jgi:hypothetical protein